MITNQLPPLHNAFEDLKLNSQSQRSLLSSGVQGSRSDAKQLMVFSNPHITDAYLFSLRIFVLHALWQYH